MKFTHQFKNCVVVGDTADVNAAELGFAPGWIETRFNDGTASDARPHLTPEYRAHARRAGYGEGDAACTGYGIEHELCHAFCAEAQGQAYSPTIYAQAHRAPDALPYTVDEIALWIVPEERVVKAFARFVNTGYRSPHLFPLRDAGCDLDALAAEWDALIISLFHKRQWWVQDE